MDDEGYYGDKQLRITGNIMAFTDDAWRSVRMAIGETTFEDPITEETKQEYGIIAENLVGKFIAGESAYIGNKEGSVLITGDGITISNGVIKSSDYSKEDKKGSIIDLRDGSFSFAGEGLTYDNSKLSIKGNITATNLIAAESGNIGGWSISNGSLSSSNADSGAKISLNSEDSSIYSTSGDDKVILTSGYLGFEMNSDKYMKLRITSWGSKPNVYGIGINSEAESKFISFGNMNTPNDNSYITPLVLNYGLDPDGNTQDILLYGSTLMLGETTIKNPLYFDNENIYLNSTEDNNLYCSSGFNINGKVCVGDTDYGDTLNVNGTGYISGDLGIGGNLSIKGESLSKIIKETTVDEAKTAKTAEYADYIYAADGSKRDPIGTAAYNSGNIRVVSIACRIKDGKNQVGVYGFWDGEDKDCTTKWITID